MDAHGFKQWMMLMALSFFVSPMARGQTQTEEPPRPLSLGVAMAWSFAPPLTVILGGLASYSVFERQHHMPSLVIIASGVAIGPMFGHAYTGEWGKSALFFLGRGLSLGSIVASFGPLIIGMNDDDEKGDLALGATGVFGGIAAFIGLTLWELIDVSRSVKRHNQSSKPGSVVFAPFLSPSTRTVEASLGLQMAGNF